MTVLSLILYAIIAVIVIRFLRRPSRRERVEKHIIQTYF